MLESYQAHASDSAALRQTTPAALADNRKSVRDHMADEMIRLSKDGRPTHVSDLEHAGFTGAQIAAHGPAASEITHGTVVRDIYADLDADTRAAMAREERIAKGARIIAGMLPDAGQLHTALRLAKFSTIEVGDLWPEIIARAAESFGTRNAGGKAGA